MWYKMQKYMEVPKVPTDNKSLDFKDKNDIN